MTDLAGADAGPSSISNGAGSGVSEATVPITLTTSLSQFAIPQGPYMVPASWRRTHLSTLVNKLVSSNNDGTAAAVPFDFIIDSSNILRTSLGDYLDSNGLTSETTLRLEYVRSTLPPTYLAAFEQDDWVSGLDCSFSLGEDGSSPIFVTSSFDGSVRLFSARQPEEAVFTFSTLNRTTMLSGSNPSLTSVRWLPNHKGVVTSGMDGKIQLYNLERVDQRQNLDATNGVMDIDGAGEWKSSKKWSGEAHNGPISALDTAQGATCASVLSGGWDGLVALWDDTMASDEVEDQSEDDEDDNDDDEENGTSKRRKLSSNGKRKKGSTQTKKAGKGVQQPTMILSHVGLTMNAVSGVANRFGLNSRVSSVLFERRGGDFDEKNGNRAWSSGYNGILSGWDLAVGGVQHTQKIHSVGGGVETKPILCMDQIDAEGFVSGGMDKSVVVWDVRETALRVCSSIVNAHSAPVSCVRTNPRSKNLWATGSHDNTVKIWDSRSTKKSLFTLTKPKQQNNNDKILTLDWSRDGKMIIAAGSDKQCTVWRLDPQ